MNNLIVVYSDWQRSASWELFDKFNQIEYRKLMMCSKSFSRGNKDFDYLIWNANYFFSRIFL